MVRLEGKFEELNETAQNNFNSTMVRLEAKSVFTTVFEFIFQFHYGTIRSGGLYREGMGESHFNSTMVRLEAIKRPVCYSLK